MAHTTFVKTTQSRKNKLTLSANKSFPNSVAQCPLGSL